MFGLILMGLIFGFTRIGLAGVRSQLIFANKSGLMLNVDLSCNLQKSADGIKSYSIYSSTGDDRENAKALARKVELPSPELILGLVGVASLLTFLIVGSYSQHPTSMALTKVSLKSGCLTITKSFLELVLNSNTGCTSSSDGYPLTVSLPSMVQLSIQPQ